MRIGELLFRYAVLMGLVTITNEHPMGLGEMIVLVIVVFGMSILDDWKWK